MSPLIKNSVFYVSKYLGLFAVSRKLIKNKLRILCYHGFTMVDEHLNVPGLFIEPEVFERRLDYLQRKGYKVIGLHDAYQSMQKGEPGADRVVITIDDGYFSVLKMAAPILHKHSFPATLYLTSYFFDRHCPVFTLAVGYMFWKTTEARVDFTSLHVPGLESESDCEMSVDKKRSVSNIIKEVGQAFDGNEKRIELLIKLGELLKVDYTTLNRNRLFNLMTRDELAALENYGIDIQLHSHRHTFPVDEELACKEIRDNKEAINPLLSSPMQHFCYPSGVWSTRHWEVLEREGVLTATTCETGLVDQDSPRFAWRRILDSSRVSQIEFEAEVSGFNELLRFVRS